MRANIVSNTHRRMENVYIIMRANNMPYSHKEHILNAFYIKYAHRYWSQSSSNHTLRESL